MSLRLAVATEDFSPSLKKAIGLAGECEVAGVRLNSRTEVAADKTTESSIRQILLSVRERQMKVAGVMCPTKHPLYEPNFLEQRLDIIRKSMSLARKLETTEVLVRSGQIPDPESQNEAEQSDSIEDKANPFSFDIAPSSKPSATAEFSLLCEILNDLTQFGNQVGCVLQLLLPTFDFALSKNLLDKVNSGPLRLVFDPATAVMNGMDVVQTFRDLYESIGYVRARDAVTNTDGGGVEAAVGRGVVDWTQFIPTLREADFDGWVCVERTGGENRADEVRHGVSCVKKLFPQSGD